MASSMYKSYRTDIPAFLHDRPPDFVKHIMFRLAVSNKTETIIGVVIKRWNKQWIWRMISHGRSLSDIPPPNYTRFSMLYNHTKYGFCCHSTQYLKWQWPFKSKTVLISRRELQITVITNLRLWQSIGFTWTTRLWLDCVPKFVLSTLS